MSENDNDILKRKRKKGGRKVIEEDEDEGGGKVHPLASVLWATTSNTITGEYNHPN
jgi:hypothetical protein